jgi:protein phosphatase PTC7
LIDAVTRNKNTGSSTAVLARIDGDTLKTTNLGDSGYVIFSAEKGTEGVRLNKIFRSKEQQYRFNFPYQCGTNCELPHKAFDNEHKVNLTGKDFVVMGSDGLFDNMYDEDLLPCLLAQIRQSNDNKFMIDDPNKAADCLAKQAYDLSKKPNYMSPFAKTARESFNIYSGGKPDDITVIVA